MRMLMATHGSSDDEVALRFGAQVARYSDEPPTILTVIQDEADHPRADAILARARELLAVSIPEMQTKIRFGPAAQEIVREAAEGSYDLIVVGERQNPNLLARFLSGSTGIRVVEHAPCPVIVAKGRTSPIKRILLCDSGAAGPLAGFATPPGGGHPAPTPSPSASPGTGSVPSLLSRLTAQLADLLGGEEEVTVLHVMSQISAGPGVKGTLLRAGVDELIEEGAPEGELLAQDVQALERPGIHARPRVRHGLVVDEILDEARTGDYDLVVIGAHRGEGWQRILLDDLAHRLIVQLDRPVLVVR
jgi:nucleotide-binding universal stress UspA family protein